jgi:hypothetical protein
MTTTTPKQTDTDVRTAAATPTEQLAAAERALKAADAAMVAASEGAAAAERGLDDAEAELLETMAAAAVESDGAAQARIKKARTDVEKARDAVEFAHLQRQAGEVAHGRAADDAAQARRRVTADEYIDEHKAYNDPAARESVLIAQLDRHRGPAHQSGRRAAGAASPPRDRRCQLAARRTARTRESARARSSELPGQGKSDSADHDVRHPMGGQLDCDRRAQR